MLRGCASKMLPDYSTSAGTELRFALSCPALLCCAVLTQLSEDALLQLAELGYSHKSSCRALRFSGGDVAAAVDFLTAQEEKKQVCAGPVLTRSLARLALVLTA